MARFSYKLRNARIAGTSQNLAGAQKALPLGAPFPSTISLAQVVFRPPQLLGVHKGHLAHTDLGYQVSKIMTTYMSVALSCQICGIFSQKSQETNILGYVDRLFRARNVETGQLLHCGML